MSAGGMIAHMQAGTGYALAIETSSAMGFVTLGRDGQVVAERALSGPRRHAVEIVATVAALCADHGLPSGDLREVYVSAGPGSFTGLRLGITVARMLAFARNVGVVAVPTLEVIAQNALEVDQPPTQVAVILDAKRSNVFAAVFERHGDGYAASCDPAEMEPFAFLSTQARGCAVMGEGVRYHRAAVERSGLKVLPERLWPPQAGIVYRLGLARARAGRFDDPRTLIPMYIRPPEAEEKYALRHGTR